MQTVLTTTADQAARDCGFVRRRRTVSGASFVQTLVFTWLDNPNATLDDLAQTHTTVAGPLSPQALDQRFTPAAADCLRRVLQAAVGHALAAGRRALPILQRFRGVYLHDSTVVSLPAALAGLWPGCGGSTPECGQAALKIQLRWELLGGALDGLALQAGRDADTAAEEQLPPLPPGALRLADLGYFDLETLQGYDQQGVYFLTRYKHGTALRVAGARVCDLARWLRGQGRSCLDVRVTVGSVQRLACRLVAERVPPAVAAKRRQRLRKEARDKGYRLSSARLALCDWSVWLTNAPAALLSKWEVRVVSRVRWQIELLFKLWKSHGQIAASRSERPYRVLCEVYAKLLAMVVQHWVLLVAWRQGGDWSLRKAARQVRQHALHLASVLRRVRPLRAVLRLLQRGLRHGLKTQKRRSKPALFQLLAAAAQQAEAAGEDSQAAATMGEAA
jgi:hypothetical protein